MNRSRGSQSLLSRRYRRTRRKLRCRRARRCTSAFKTTPRLELLESRLLLASDFGDAPLPYPTTLAEGGAEHVSGGAMMLGATVDSEADGTHSAAADADGADEDGVTFGTMVVGALDAQVTVNVQGSGGKLDAWIDFNGDGSWGGPGERIFSAQEVTTGDNVLTLDVPSYAIAGTTYARFRVSALDGLGVGGTAADGEVEDYHLRFR